MNSSKDYVDIPKSQYTTQADKSVLTFSAKTDMDFGTYTCQATDPVGQASKPCTFQIIPKGKTQAKLSVSFLKAKITKEEDTVAKKRSLQQRRLH